MTVDSAFTGWIETHHEKIRSGLTPHGAKSYDRFRLAYRELDDLMKELPPSVSMYEIYKVTPKDLMPLFPDPFSALSHACECLVGYWAFRHYFKMKAYLKGFSSSLQDGNWIVGCTSLRGVFEEVVHFDFFLSRLDREIQTIEKLERNEEKRLKQGKMPSEQWVRDYLQSQLEIIKKMDKALHGSDFDWSNWSASVMEQHTLEKTEKSTAPKKPRKTHINDCLEHMGKKYKSSFEDYYNLLSEMVHPNFGSNMLVLVSRHKMSSIFGELQLGSLRSHEQASWFLEVLSAPMAETFSIGHLNIKKSQHLYRVFQKRAANSSASINHLLKGEAK